jgi:hypothetical protein
MEKGTSEKAEQTRLNDTYTCRYRAFLRICLAEGKLPDQVFKGAGIQPYIHRRLRKREPMELGVYKKLADALNCEPTVLFYSTEQATSYDDMARRFARRVERLLDEGLIPDSDPDTGAQTNVVEYVSQMADPVISNMRMTDRERLEGWLILRDECLRVYERPIQNGVRRKLIGAMHIGPTPKSEIIADFEARRANSKQAFAALEEQYRLGNHYHVKEIQDELPARIAGYLAAARADHYNISIDGGYVISERLIDNVIAADFHVRKIIFPTAQQEETFHQYFGRSRRLIYHARYRFEERFRKWWDQDFLPENTKDIEAIGRAWPRDAEPNWPLMEKALDRTIDRAIDAVEDFYPDLGEDGSTYTDDVSYYADE